MQLYNVSISVTKPETPKGRKKAEASTLPAFEVKMGLRELFPVKKCKEGYTTEFGRIFTEETFRTISEGRNSLQDKSYYAECMCPKRLIKPMKHLLKHYLSVRISEQQRLLEKIDLAVLSADFEIKK